MESNNTPMGKLLSFIPVAVLLSIMMFAAGLLGFYFGMKKHPDWDVDPTTGKNNAQAMVEFTRTLPDEFHFADGSLLSAARSFSITAGSAATRLTVASAPDLPQTTAKDIVTAEMKLQDWRPEDIEKTGTMTVGGENMYYALKKQPEAPQEADEPQDESNGTGDSDKSADAKDETAVSDQTAQQDDLASGNSNTTTHEMVGVVYASKNIEQGEIIPQEALEVKEISADKAPVDAFNSVNAIVGQEAACPIPAGSLMLAHDVRPMSIGYTSRRDQLIAAVVTKDGKKFIIDGNVEPGYDFKADEAFRFLSYLKRWK